MSLTVNTALLLASKQLGDADPTELIDIVQHIVVSMSNNRVVQHVQQELSVQHWASQPFLELL